MMENNPVIQYIIMMIREGDMSRSLMISSILSAVCGVREALLKTNGNFRFFHSRSGGELQQQAQSHLQAAIDLDDAIKSESNPSPEPRSIADSITANDNLLYIYTSGTTGLPKAVIIKHIRFGLSIILMLDRRSGGDASRTPLLLTIQNKSRKPLAITF